VRAVFTDMVQANYSMCENMENILLLDIYIRKLHLSISFLNKARD